MQHNHIHSDNDFLQIFCHYPLITAEEEYNSSQKDMYRVTTINWTIATNEVTEETDFSCVHKNIYEMSLGEFQNWCIDVCNEEVLDIIRKKVKL